MFFVLSDSVGRLLTFEGSSPVLRLRCLHPCFWTDEIEAATARKSYADALGKTLIMQSWSILHPGRSARRVRLQRFLFRLRRTSDGQVRNAVPSASYL